MTHPATLALALLLAGMAGGCAPTGRPIGDTAGDSGFGERAPRQEIALEVENQNFADATIYAVWGSGRRDRLGTVTGLTSQSFKVAIRGMDLRIQVDFLAGGVYTSEPMPVGPEESVRFTIPPG